MKPNTVVRDPKAVETIVVRSSQPLPDSAMCTWCIPPTYRAVSTAGIGEGIKQRVGMVYRQCWPLILKPDQRGQNIQARLFWWRFLPKHMVLAVGVGRVNTNGLSGVPEIRYRNRASSLPQFLLLQCVVFPAP
ncbi:MAG: hypothetical protein Ct9H300mP13_0960 [Gammaproteobacteria bacterium]|nr:MAG: hypothetical protein Ct9H300mP13_0960 [Gammaproteobacteria bacterium]